MQVEAPNTPRFVGQFIRDCVTQLTGTSIDSINVINFNRKVWDRRAGTAFCGKANLDWGDLAGTKCNDPTVIH